MITAKQIKEIANIDYSSNFLKDYNGLLLTENEVETLKRYDIDIRNYSNLSELIYVIDEIIDDIYTDPEELEWLLEKLQERNYYENTNK